MSFWTHSIFFVQKYGIRVGKDVLFDLTSHIFYKKKQDMCPKEHPFRHISFKTYIPRDIYPFSVFGSVSLVAGIRPRTFVSIVGMAWKKKSQLVRGM